MTKIIAELGINHNGSFSKCKKMIDQSFNAGCWGVKFQYRNLNKKLKVNSFNSEIGLEIINKELKKNYLKPNRIKKLSNYARKLGLNVGISFFQSEDVNDFDNYKFDFYKVPSAEALDFDLIKKLIKKKVFLLISLGGLSLKDILFLKKKIRPLIKKSQVCFMHCVSNYPLNPVNANIGFINRLKKIFLNNFIGYSSHESSIHNCIIALSKDIDFIERHFTINKKSKGLDHTSSSDLDEMKQLCFYSKNYNLISRNSNLRNLNQGEKINIQNLGKSAFSKENFKKGDLISLRNIYFKPPRIGLTKNELMKFLKLKLLKNIPKDSPITTDCFLKPITFNTNLRNFSNLKNLSIPIRPYDYKKMNSTFDINHYEFHLSFNDIKNFKIKTIDKEFLKVKTFTVHGSDYCNENEVLDIFSKDTKIKKISNIIFKKTIDICKSLKKISGKEVNLIQSFSSSEESINKHKQYLLIKNLVNKVYKKNKIKILPQWLPPIAWYFGGSVNMSLFSNPQDLNFIKKIKLEICMDLSHFVMSCNYYNLNLSKYFNGYEKLFYHYHVADSSGIDSEGLALGDGDLTKKHLNILKKVINSDKVKVLEAWQGHLNDGKIFKGEINKIYRIHEK